MEIRYLNTFIQVAERGSFTKAAEALSYNQSTVSTQIKQLEEELNTQLFERINHTVTLTQSGRALLTRAHQIINLVDEVRSDSFSEQAGNVPVRFAMAPSVCSTMMGETFLNFNKLHPDVNVKIIEAETDRMLQLINHNDADLVFLVDRRRFSNDYIVAYEKKEKVHFVVNKNSPLAAKKNISIEEVLTYPLFLSEKGLSYRSLFDEKLAEKNLSVTPIVEMGNTQLILELIELGNGISFLPEYVTAKSYNEGKIAYLRVDDFEIEIWRQLIYHKNKWVSPAMKKIIDYCSYISEKVL